MSGLGKPLQATPGIEPDFYGPAVTPGLSHNVCNGYTVSASPRDLSNRTQLATNIPALPLVVDPPITVTSSQQQMSNMSFVAQNRTLGMDSGLVSAFEGLPQSDLVSALAGPTEAIDQNAWLETCTGSESLAHWSEKMTDRSLDASHNRINQSRARVTFNSSDIRREGLMSAARCFSIRF